ncbi:MAG: hypothetical protein PVI44_02200 [Balneolaceae bacterium]
MFFIIILACDDKRNEIVNRDYIQSEGYAAFERNAKREISQNLSRANTLQASLEKLPKCSQNGDLSLPKDIAGELFSEARRRGICGDPDSEYPLKLVGRDHFKNFDLYLVLIDDNLLNTSRKLLGVTFKTNQLLSYRMIGLFKKSISKDISSKIKIRKDGGIIKIISKTERVIRYPIEQRHVIVNRFEINEYGEIHLVSK